MSDTTEQPMSPWEYAGTRFVQYANGRDETFHAVAVNHPRGRWDAIYCRSEDIARHVAATGAREARIRSTTQDAERAAAIAYLLIQYGDGAVSDAQMAFFHRWCAERWPTRADADAAALAPANPGAEAQR